MKTLITLLLTFCVGSSFSQVTLRQVDSAIKANMILLVQGDSIFFSNGKIGLTKPTVDKFNKMFSDLYTHLGMASESTRITAVESRTKTLETKQLDDDKMKAKLKTILVISW